MLKEIYCIPENETRYKDGVIEVDSELDVIIQQIDLLLFTKKGDVLMLPEFGINLEEYLFETTWNHVAIKQVVMEQIRNYIYLEGSYDVDVDINFVTWEYNVAMVVDLKINNRKVASYLV